MDQTGTINISYHSITNNGDVEQWKDRCIDGDDITSRYASSKRF